MTGSALVYRVLDAVVAKQRFDALVECYVDVYRATDDPFFGEDRYRQQLESHLRAPGWAAVTAVHGETGGMVGYVYGFTLASSTRWWDGIVDEDDALTRETGDRTVAISEIMVREPWRRRGVARRLHDRFLMARSESRATLLVEPDNDAAQNAYARWGWRKANRLRPGWQGAPLYDVLILDRLPSGPAA